MNPDAFAFFNEQLAAMLRQGLPLEGALRRLAQDMERGRLRTEIARLEADLAQGTPLEDALKARRFPPLYTQLLLVGRQGGDLPAVLTLAADHYHQAARLWLRLKGLMVYPLLVLGIGFVMSAVIAAVFWSQTGGATDAVLGFAPEVRERIVIWLVVVPLSLGLLFAAAVAALALPGLRHRLRWRLPAWRDASLARFASSMAALLAGGVRLPDALRLLAGLEPEPGAARAIQAWEAQCSAGHPDAAKAAAPGDRFPPLFRWLVHADPGDRPGGFRRAADVYDRRARARTEMLLYAALPACVLVLGVLITVQTFMIARLIVWGVMDPITGME